MSWNKAEYERGVKDALHEEEVNGMVSMLVQYNRYRHTNVGEYLIGWQRGVRRVLIDKGFWSKCAEFVIAVEGKREVAEFISEMIKEGRARWVSDPDVQAVVALMPTDGSKDAFVIVYLEDGDAEESLKFLEMLDDRNV